MKATHTAEYFSKFETLLFEKYKRTCDFESQLEMLLPDFSNLPEEVREKASATVTKMYAQKVVDTATADLKKEMRKINEIRKGNAALGYTTVQQEVRAWHDLNEGFEFSCWKLAQFKQRYGL